MITVIDKPEFVIQGCFLGLALVIAVYTLVHPQIIKIKRKSVDNIVILDKELNDKWSTKSEKTLNIQEMKDKMTEFTALQDKIESEKSIPFELEDGFIISIVSFSIPLLIYSLSGMGINNPFLDDFFSDNVLAFIFYFGTLFFIVEFILVFLKLKTLARNEFDELVKKTKEDTEKKLAEAEAQKKLAEATK